MGGEAVCLAVVEDCIIVRSRVASPVAVHPLTVLSSRVFYIGLIECCVVKF